MKKEILWAALLAAPLFGSCSAAPVENVAVNATAVAAGPGLEFAVSQTGLSSLSYNGQNLFGYAWNGYLRPTGRTPQIRKPDGATSSPEDKPAVVYDAAAQKLTQTYPWGVITAIYKKTVDRLTVQLSVKNLSATDTISALNMQVAEMVFPEIPQGRTLEAGMWGTGSKWGDLNAVPLAVPGDKMPPAIFIRYSKGAIAFVAENGGRAPNQGTVAIPFTTNPGTKLMYPFWVTFGSIAPGATAESTVSLRFADKEAGTDALAGDILANFRKAYPYAVKWPDRRAIGALFLATSQAHPPTNPRGWFTNDKNVDTTTPEGLAKWRERLLKFADDSIKVLKDMDAQGMITWDPEGEEFANATYYGDPRLTATLAPETDFKGTAKLAAIDAYFQKFRDAGFKTGVCLRPQEIELVDGKPGQHESDDPTKTLLDKVAYAKKRWGCTLFYVDSTVDKSGSISADVFRAVAQKNPDILMFPENENLRYYAYSAPLNSFAHHHVTSTPMGPREAYPGAFSGLLATASQAQYDAGREELIAAVRRGDIMIVNAWYGGYHIDETKKIYAGAKAAP